MDYRNYLESKIFGSGEDFEPLLQRWKNEGLKVVFTNGCFDLIHRGHVEYLAEAAGKGDRLVVGLNSDASVARLKGDGRPLVDERSRALLLAAFHFVSAVVLFQEDTPVKLIGLVRPFCLVKGGDYTADSVAGSSLVRSYGGTVDIISLTPGFSTSALLLKIKRQEPWAG